MRTRITRSVIALFGFLTLVTLDAIAAPPVRLAESTVYQYGGPETRTRCVQEAKTKGIPNCRLDGLAIVCEDTWISTCVGWATDFQQHAYVVAMYGSPDMNPDQLTTIKDACFTSAVASQVNGVTFTADSIVQLLSSRRPVMEGMFITCLKTTETLGKIVVSDFRLEVERKDFW